MPVLSIIVHQTSGSGGTDVPKFDAHNLICAIVSAGHWAMITFWGNTCEIKILDFFSKIEPSNLVIILGEFLVPNTLLEHLLKCTL